MPSSTPSMFLPLLPILWAAVASFMFWKNLSSPWLFAICTLLILFGVQAIASFFYSMWPSMFGNYFLESATSIEDINHRIILKNKEAIVVSIVVFFVGLPIIWWLRNGLSK